MKNCILCNKPLTEPESVARGIGPDCWEKLQSDVWQHTHSFADRYCGTLSEEVILKRGKDDAPLSNVTHKVFLHATKGYEWGNNSAGAADLALNILWHFAKPAVALQWYQTFKHDFLLTMPHEGSIIKGQEIRNWIRGKTQALFE
jgi:hypothetical protein